MKERANNKLKSLEHNVSEAVNRVVNQGTKPLYIETAGACEEVNDAMLRDSGGTTEKVMEIAVAKARTVRPHRVKAVNLASAFLIKFELFHTLS